MRHSGDNVDMTAPLITPIATPKGLRRSIVRVVEPPVSACTARSSHKFYTESE